MGDWRTQPNKRATLMIWAVAWSVRFRLMARFFHRFTEPAVNACSDIVLLWPATFERELQ